MSDFVGSPFSLESVTQVGTASVRVRFTNDPKASSASGTNDALNPNNYSITGPSTNAVVSVSSVSGDPQGVHLELTGPLTTGIWTLGVANIKSIDDADLTPPTSLTFPTVTQATVTPISQGAESNDAETLVRKFVPFKGKGWDALTAAIAVGDQYNSDLARSVFDQIFTSTAADVFLDRQAGNSGIVRPTDIGLSDDLFRKIVIKTTNYSQIPQVMLDILEIYYGSEATRASVTSTIAEPYTFSSGDTLTFELNAKTVITTQFEADDFSQIGLATAEEVALAITRSCHQAGNSAYAVAEFDPALNATFVRIYSGVLGLRGSLRVLGGRAQNTLQFPTLVHSEDTGPLTDTQFTVTAGTGINGIASGTVRFTFVDGPNPNLLSVYVDDYVNIFSAALDTSLWGTYQVTAITDSYFEITDNRLAWPASITLLTPLDIRFYRPTIQSIQNTGRVATVSHGEPGVLDVVLPATTQAVGREAGSGAYLHSDSPLAITGATRDSSGVVTIATATPHGLTTGERVAIDGLYPDNSITTTTGFVNGDVEAVVSGTKSNQAVKLTNGKILVVGGDDGTSAIASCYLFDPVTNNWSAAADLNIARVGHTLTLLKSGKVLVVGGGSATSELYDPDTNTWSTSGDTIAARTNHTSVLLDSGKVFVVGGEGGSSDGGGGIGGGITSTDQTAPPVDTFNMIQIQQMAVDSTNQYAGSTLFINSDAAFVVHVDGTISTVTPPAGTYDRFSGVGTTIGDGYTAFLVLRGSTDEEYNAYFFDWATETFSATTSPPARTPYDGDGVYSCCAMAGYQILVVYGPFDSGTSSTPCYVFDVSTETWTATGSYPGPYANSWSPLVLLNDLDVLDPGLGHDSGSTRYNQASGTWTILPSGPADLWTYYSDTNIGFIKLQSGKVALCVSVGYISIFDPATNTWTDQPEWDQGHYYNETWIVEYEPNKLFIHGSVAGDGLIALYDITTQTWTDLTFGPGASFPLLIYGGWRNTNKWFGINTESGHGQAQVEFSLGGGGPSGPLKTTELYDPVTGTWSAGLDASIERSKHCSVKLNDGRVVVVGGSTTNITEVFNPTNNTWRTASACPVSVDYAKAVLFRDKVLFHGGIDSTDTVSAGLYQFTPATMSWSALSSGVARYNHQLVWLKNGNLMAIGGGGTSTTALASTQSYDPINNLWQDTEPMTNSRLAFSALGLDDARVLVVGGSNNDTLIRGVELYSTYDPVLAAGRLNGDFNVLSTPTPTSFTYQTGSTASTTALASGTVTPLSGVSNSVQGPFIYDTEDNSAITVIESTLSSKIVKDSHNSTLVLADATSFPDEEGYVMLGFGTDTQTGPIKYLGRISSTQLLIDPSYAFPQTLPIGTTVTKVTQRGVWVPPTPEKVGSFYLTAASAGRVAASNQIDELVAAGITVNKTVTYPGDTGLGNQGYPDSDSEKISDRVYVWGGDE